MTIKDLTPYEHVCYLIGVAVMRELGEPSENLDAPEDVLVAARWISRALVEDEATEVMKVAGGLIEKTTARRAPRRKRALRDAPYEAPPQPRCYPAISSLNFSTILSGWCGFIMKTEPASRLSGGAKPNPEVTMSGTGGQRPRTW